MIKLKLRRGPLGPVSRRVQVPYEEGKTLIHYIPERYRKMDIVDVKFNGRDVKTHELEAIIPADGALISVSPVAGIWVALIGIAFSIILKVGLWAYDELAVKPEDKRRERLWNSIERETYSLSVMANSYDDGSPIPVVMGRHRVGGMILQQTTDASVKSSSLSTTKITISNRDQLLTHMGLSQGPINGVSDVHINGNDLATFSGAVMQWKPGVVDQSAYAFTEFRSETAHTVNNALNDGAGGVNTVTLTGTISAKAVRLKITMMNGLYRIKSSGFATNNLMGVYIKNRRSAVSTTVNGNSAAGQKVLNVAATTRFTAGDYVLMDSGGAREETKIIDTVQAGTSITFTADLDYEHTAVQADPVATTWGAATDIGTMYLSRSVFSAYINHPYPDEDIYDTQVVLIAASDNTDKEVYGDAYLKEWAEINDFIYDYPGMACMAVSAVADEQLSGQAPRITGLVEGIKVQTMTSATVVAASNWTRNPADLLLSMLYNSDWGVGEYIDTRLECTVAGGAAAYTVGEIVTGPTDHYQFRGEVVSWTAATEKLVVKSLRGLPHGTITGADSGCARAMVTIDEGYGVDFPAFYELKEFNNEYVPDGTTGTTVNVNSAATQKVLKVAATTGFTAGDYVSVNFEGDRAEIKVIDTIQVGTSLTFTENLTYAHTAAQADKVRVAEIRHYFDYRFDGRENGWEAIERICKTCRAMPVRYGSLITVRPLKEETPTQLIGMGNIKQGSFKVSWRAKGDRPNYLNVLYLDEDLDYQRQSAPVHDPAITTNNETIRKIEIELFGVTRQSQAFREAWWRLKRLRYVGKEVSFTVDADGLDIEVGDVVRLGHAVIGAGSASGRLDTATSTTCKLDHAGSVVSGDSIYVRHLDGTIEEKTTTNATGTHKDIVISAPWDSTPTGTEPYIIGTPGRYRIIKFKLNQDFTVDIQAEEDDTSYYSEDYGDTPDYTATYLVDPDKIPTDVTNVTISETTEAGVKGELENHLDVTWEEADQNLGLEYDIFYRLGLGSVDSYGHRRVIGEALADDTLTSPYGVCSDEDYIYFSDTQEDRIFKIDYLDLSFVAKTGTTGTGNANFKSPMGMWTNGVHLWVCDMGNHRLKRHLCSDLSFVDEIGSYGTADGEFNQPTCVSGNSTHVFVTDKSNHRVQKFTHAMAWVSTIGGTASGSGNDQFSLPHGIAVSAAGDYMVVADTNNYRIQKRQTNDAMTYSTKIGTHGKDTDKFCGPYGVGIDYNDTYVYVADYGLDPNAAPAAVHFKYGRMMARDYSDLAAAEVFADDATEWGGRAGSADNQFERPLEIDMDWEHFSQYMFLGNGGNGRINRYSIGTDPDWIHAGKIEGNTIRIPGKFDFGDLVCASVCARSPNGNRKIPDDAPQDSHVVTGYTKLPDDVYSFYFSAIGNYKVILNWAKATDRQTAYYEIRTGTDWQSGIPVVENYKSNSYELTCPVGVTTVVWIAGVDEAENYSLNPKSLTLSSNWNGMFLTPVTGGTPVTAGNIKTG